MAPSNNKPSNNWLAVKECVTSSLEKYVLKKIHLISFDVPYPANYGGIIVVYYYIKALHAAGVKVILHCFLYDGKKAQPHLETLCEEVHYYERKKSLWSALSNLPFIVNSRKPEALLKRLQQDEYPIFFEGVHTTAWINHVSLRDRKKVVRMHNVEWKYYASLHALSKNKSKKIYFQIESQRLKKYDQLVAEHADILFTISPKDQAYYSGMHTQSYYLPAFHANETLSSKTGNGDYFLFHGKLSVEDNKQAAMYLMDSVFAGLQEQLIIAGLEPDEELLEATKKYSNVLMESNVTEERMGQLLDNAQGNILYTSQDNGLKLKLLYALYRGRHCIVNPLMVSNTTDLAALCSVCEGAAMMIKEVKRLSNQPFTEEDKARRAQILDKGYDNARNALYSVEIMEKCGFN